MLELSLEDQKKLRKVARALSSEVRLQIISLLSSNNMNINQLAESIDIPMSTAASHIKVLEEAGLILTELRPASRGAMKVCTRNFDDIHIKLNTSKIYTGEYETYEIEMPIGQYTDFSVSPTCGMADHEGFIIQEDDPVNFYNPARSKAQLIWTRKGYLEYKFPLAIPPNAKVKEVLVSFEVCSEAPNHDHQWPSDITVWLNGIGIGTWTSPGDFGDRPGKLNPKYWAESTSTQYGTLKTWKVTEDNAMIDDIPFSDLTIDALNLHANNFLTFRVGIKENALHKGGFNIFGKEFGDYPQDIKLKVVYQ
ncbi:helix-turn-helix domain-containing protein [Gracilibacillus oryzae]|uniref:Helix-turn-helix domain-containing protein n=1 Tax=Gracilibacillus oryzae TaxID=1672701 RepID=A0A7C8GQF6_9BACI|nr:helix-turn-helix domain-containing protein [Gracilibacillus oryzae]KAB8126374.1 helix-turn-helix domain-containing protein [Gracilibacillus oryzae]